jgi:hypothetical protein
VVDEQVGLRLGPGKVGVLVEVGHAVGGQHVLAQERVPGAVPAGLGDHRVGRVGVQLGLARPGHRRLAAEQVLHRGGGDQRPRPQRVGGDAVTGELGGQTQRAQGHPVLGDRVPDVRGEPAGFQADRRGQGQDVRVRRSLQVRDAGPADHERAAGVDRLHQVIALDLQRLGAGQVDRRGVVDAHVDPAEPLDGLRDGPLHLGLVADVADHRQRVAACGFELLGGGVHRPLELGVRFGRLGDQRDVGAVPRRPQRDGQADATAATRDEQGLARQRHRCLPRARSGP